MNFKEWLIFESRRPFIGAEELHRRLLQLGWTDGHRNGSHLMLYAPKTAVPVAGTGSSGTGHGMTTIALNPDNWQRGYGTYATNILRQFPDLEGFLYNSPFSIPKNFDIKTQSYQRNEIPSILKVGNLFNLLQSHWKHPEDALIGKTINGLPVLLASFDSGKLEIIYQNNSSEEIGFHQNIQIKPDQWQLSA